MEKEQKVSIRAYSKKEIANMYQVSRSVMWKWYKEAGFYERYPGFVKAVIIKPNIVQAIFEEFGEPK